MQIKKFTMFVLLNLMLVSLLFSGSVSASEHTIQTSRTVDPSTIFLSGSGHNPERTTITLSVNGFGGTTTQAAPLDIVFSIDTSGSMTVNDPSNLRHTAAQSFVDKLDSSKDRAGVIGWDTSVDLQFGMSNDFAAVKYNIGLTDASGGTNLDLGLSAPITMLNSQGRADAAKAIIYLSDGQGFYTPSTNPSSLTHVAASNGYKVYSIALGSSANEVALNDMAQTTGGIFYDAPTAANLQQIFDDIYSEIITSTSPSQVNLVETTQNYIVGAADFSVTPDSVVQVDGKTVIVWNNIAQYVGDGDDRLTAEETFTVSYTAESTKAGKDLPVSVMGEAVVNFVDPQGVSQTVNIPQGYISVYQPVDIDIKPQSFPNSINLKAKGMLPVAILTTDEFDASTIDPTTVEFEGAEAARWNMEDVDGDGDLDMILHFDRQSLELTSDSTEGVLTGETVDGAPVVGSDSVRIVPPNGNSGNGNGNGNSQAAKIKSRFG